MANASAKGVVLDENGAPLQGLVAWVRRKWNFSEIGSELGSATTGATGAFLVNYSAFGMRLRVRPASHGTRPGAQRWVDVHPH
jgi:hypothetical protein